MKAVYLSCYELISVLRDELRAGKFDLKDMVNAIYVMREIAKLADDLRKENEGVLHLFENVACAMWVTNSEAKSIKGALATGTPDVKLALKIPNARTEPEAYAKLMKHFGIPMQVVSDKIMKPYWPGLCAYISTLSEEGKPLPPGVDPDKTYPTYKMRIKSYKDLTELSRHLEQAGRKEADEILDTACNDLLTKRQC